jgi:phosphoglycolate phosphatase
MWCSVESRHPAGNARASRQQENKRMKPGALIGVTVAFDLDGTLVDTAQDLIGALNRVMDDEGLPRVSERQVGSLVGFGARALVERGLELAGLKFDTAGVDRLFDRFIVAYRRDIARHSRPYPGCAETLQALSGAGALLVICTNKRSDLAEELLRALGLDRRFAAVVGPDRVTARKPDPAHVLEAIAAAGGRADRAILVGDSIHDTKAARAARVACIAVSHGYADRPTAALGADAVVDRLADIPPTLLRLLAR